MWEAQEASILLKELQSTKECWDWEKCLPGGRAHHLLISPLDGMSTVKPASLPAALFLVAGCPVHCSSVSMAPQTCRGYPICVLQCLSPRQEVTMLITFVCCQCFRTHGRSDVTFILNYQILEGKPTEPSVCVCLAPFHTNALSRIPKVIQ